MAKIGWGNFMALVKITLENGSDFEIEMSAEIADNTVAHFAKFINEGKRQENRQIVDSSQSFYIDYAKVVAVRREF